MRPQYLTSIFSLTTLVCAKVLDRQALTYAPIPDDIYKPPNLEGETTLWDLIQSREELSDLASLVSEIPGFQQAFETTASWGYTFFAPSNAAFNNTGQYYQTFAETAKGKWWLGQMLQHHYIPNSRLYVANFTTERTRIQMGSYLHVGSQLVDGKLVLNGAATVTKGDIPATQGIVHVIDRIISPDAQIYEADVRKTPQNFIPGSCSNPDLPYC